MQPRSIRFRRGSTVHELLAAGVLLIATTGTVATAAVHCQRLSKDGREYRLAVDELAMQMERLLTVETTQLPDAMENLQPSDSVSQSLKQVRLWAELIEDSSGQRIVIRLQWQRLGDPPPLMVVGWPDLSLTSPAATGSTP